MRTNLIQSYMNNQPVNDRKLDIEYVLSNRTFIKPLPPKGHLVNNGLLNMPVNSAKRLAYDAKSVKNAIQGKANDHELGKVNDIGMKAGGLAIALYLMTRKQTPLTKAMEFIGLGSFFGAMALWPKVALQLPAKLIHGFNIRKKYEDSYGREKLFFQDPQYIPWDLVNDKKLHKIGNWLNIPDDIPNRKEFIQEKMKKIAVQNNTMWMMTAGFATPVFSALICNALEKPLNDYLGKQSSKKANKLLSSINDSYEEFVDKKGLENFKTLLNSNKNKEITPEFVKQAEEILLKDINPLTAKSFSINIKEMLGLSDKKYIVDDSVIDNIIRSVDDISKHKVVLNKDTLKALLKSNEFSEEEIKKLAHQIGKEVKKQTNDNNVIYKLVNSENSVLNILKTKQNTVLSQNTISKLMRFSNKLFDFKAKNAILDKYIYLKSAAAPETVAANAWNEVTSAFPKIFNLSEAEIKAARHDSKIASKMLREKLGAVTSNEIDYERVFKSLLNKIVDLEMQIKDLDLPADIEGSYEMNVNKVFGEFGEFLQSNGMDESVEALVGKNGAEGSLKNIQLSYVKDRLLGIRSSMYRMLNTLDLFRRISTQENILALHKNMPKEIKEEVAKLARDMSIEGSTSDFITKFYALRNPKPNMKLSDIRVEAGRVIYEYLNGKKVDLPNDKTFFKEVMKLMFENDIHPDTKKLLSKSLIEEGFKNYRKDFLNEIGNSYYFVKQYHLLSGNESKATSFTKFLRMGMSPEKMFHKSMQEAFNQKSWLKTFGSIGAGLFALTVLTQFFFGKMKNPERINHD